MNIEISFSLGFCEDEIELKRVKYLAQLLTSNNPFSHTSYFPVFAQRGKGLADTFNLCPPPHSKVGGAILPYVSGRVSDSAQGTPSPCPAPQTGPGPSKGLIKGERPLSPFPSSFQDS